MIYLYLANGIVDAHTDKSFAEGVLKLGEPIAVLTEREWDNADGMARMIDGELVLGKTELEKADELLAEQQALLNDPILRLEALEGALLDIITGGIEND